ncbi:MAG: folylpolyglutamate synthase/dihydrofolate synthase family protein [Rickettsiales bacterium]|nr:folylpolyglutamate synthase/dihydrofolate synthase family protein [Rickettsiales bacterium]
MKTKNSAENNLFWPNFKGYRDIDLKLNRVYDLLTRLDNPHLKIPPVIHIAGTNGKGSTLAFLYNIFSEAGYKVHCYTSPHLVKFNERIILSGKEISDDFLNECLLECQKAAEKSPQIPVTFFEGITVAAFLAFSRVKADLVLLEVGMGGRLDATNVLAKVLCAVITPISFDHTDFLGKTLDKIAFEKGGIIKKNCPVIIAKQKSLALKTLQNIAREKNSVAKIFNQDWQVRKIKNGFIFFGFGKKMILPLPNLLGAHQIENASTAIAASITQDQFKIDENHIKLALGKTFWPARLQKINHGKFFKLLPKNCELYLDGSHNLQGANTIKKFFQHHKNKKILVIFSMLQDKDCAGFLKKISDKIDYLITMSIDGESKSRKASHIKKIAEKIGIKSQIAKDFNQAFTQILLIKKSGKKNIEKKFEQDFLILICGSLYLAGNFLKENLSDNVVNKIGDTKKINNNRGKNRIPFGKRFLQK